MEPRRNQSFRVVRFVDPDLIREKSPDLLGKPSGIRAVPSQVMDATPSIPEVSGEMPHRAEKEDDLLLVMPVSSRQFLVLDHQDLGIRRHPGKPFEEGISQDQSKSAHLS